MLKDKTQTHTNTRKSNEHTFNGTSFKQSESTLHNYDPKKKQRPKNSSQIAVQPCGTLRVEKEKKSFVKQLFIFGIQNTSAPASRTHKKFKSSPMAN